VTDTTSNWDGIEVNFDALVGGGGYDWYNVTILVGGQEYRLLHGYMVAGLREIDGKVVTATEAAAAAAPVLEIAEDISTVAGISAAVETVAANAAAVGTVADNMAAVLAAPGAATAAADSAGEAEDSATAAAASAAGVNLPAITVADAGKALLVNPEGTGYVVGKVASLPVLITENTTLAAGQSYRIGGSSALTLTLPADPAAGDAILLVDGESISATVQHAVARNGQTIMGLAENLTLDMRGIAVQLWFNGMTWRLF
jgi:hypothetical protein